MSPQWLRAGQAFDRLPVGKENSLPHCWVHTSQAWGSHNSPHEGAIWTKASSGVGEVFYNAVQQFRDLGLALKFFAPVNPCAQQRDPLLDWLKKPKMFWKFWGGQKLSWRVRMRQKWEAAPHSGNWLWRHHSSELLSLQGLPSFPSSQRNSIYSRVKLCKELIFLSVAQPE